MSKKRIFSRMLVALLTVVSVLQVATVSSNAAGNYRDTEYTFEFENEQLYTRLRAKQDNTSSYMKCNTCTTGTSYTAHVVAANRDTNTPYYDVSNGHTYLFTANTTYKMINYAYEYGYSYAAIACSPNYTYQFTASGLWSPDSV
ncbi:MAG: hypothetical protein IKK03_05645 [Lachnospiraceae bacterium]|nr:hypothetical protein [Lachnospiraceae bacterium]